MGFFDRFKKKQDDQKIEEQKKQPLTLKYSDGTVAQITFNGTCDVDGKSLHSANILYIAEDNSFKSRSVLLEPIMSQNEGQWVDSTEQYYRWMAERDGTQEAGKRYGAVKGFFKQSEITEEKMGSNYIGNIAQKEDGQYFRYFDKQFKSKYIENIRAKKAQERSAALKDKLIEDPQMLYEEKQMELGRRQQDAFSRILVDGLVDDAAFEEYCNLVNVKDKAKLREQIAKGEI